jgi:acetyltransferase-like isoleucine patch superfamily enzyme
VTFRMHAMQNATHGYGGRVLRLLLARMRTRGRVRAGRGVRVGRGVRFDVAAGGTLVLGAGVAVGERTRFDIAGDVRIGAGTRLGPRCRIAARERITIGARCVLGDEVVVLDFDHETADVERPVRLQGLLTSPVTVGDGACLDDAVVVLRGAEVGAGARVTTRSVVTAAVAAGATATGVPARQVESSSSASAARPAGTSR